ncbi:hypothetical protein [Streptomyces sp. NL15-2K]|uniref:hypothetical protein n=1 Tax=Streptomyces sp. NL15-2K TaxID=376149 RepID=UPI000F55A577|nr:MULTISPECIES: hypothetical protein [Actinomycetes]WKX15871.1 hypothetical protein Q4V64_53645 [Kutzneria buriramensis]GCB42719.1 hypothetical protein SNL152K_1 [Streptomyces sp. NL15-2K]
MPKLRRIAVATLAASAITIATATSAHAYTIDDRANSSNTCGTTGFSSYGEVFRMLDLCSDGKGVRLQATNPTTGTPSTSDAKWAHDYTGGYTGFDFDDAHIYNTSMSEDACFYFRTGHVDNGAYVSGSYGLWSLACAAG